MLLAVDFDVVAGQVRLGQPYYDADEYNAENHPRDEVNKISEHDSLPALDSVRLKPLAVEVGQQQTGYHDRQVYLSKPSVFGYVDEGHYEAPNTVDDRDPAHELHAAVDFDAQAAVFLGRVRHALVSALGHFCGLVD